MTFAREADFEAALLEVLPHKGWEAEILKNPTEKDLLRNWAAILFQNNRDVDRLNDVPLTDGEMQQIIEQITALRTPLKLNGFINGRYINITRDNPADALHFGKEISLKIYDRREIAAGQSRYQIAQQPIYASKSAVLNNRRGDLMLLINGMPVIHIELKRSGVSVSQACYQIEKYSHEGIFTGLFALVQIFVAMEPNETVYFANPGADGRFNRDFFFHWADFNNEPMNDWQAVASSLLSIPMAHQLIGFYTVADNNDGVLKVMRSYQYYAASKISDRVAQYHWDGLDRLGGYVWHTTGSGKTMTSFKSAQLVAGSRDADKVIFLVDRIELGTQSLKEYRSFAEESESIAATEDTDALIAKLKSDNPANTLIVTSIQKMSNIKAEDGGTNAHDIDRMSAKRIVFITDEAHRSTFGEMLITIKNSFPKAMFFGFTGTPIHEENQRSMNTTADLFGSELHRYSIADGIRDKNVLGFDPYKVLTFRDKELREAVALEKAKAATAEEAFADPKKAAVFGKYMDASRVSMIEIEGQLPKAQYRTDTHRDMVVEDIARNWVTLSQGGKFHAMFATSSIAEAITYYRLIKEAMPALRVTCLFDPNIDNNEGAVYKEDGLVEIIEDYNARYGQDFSLKNFDKMKKDIAARLAHKSPYQRIDRTPEQQLDLLIVVDQMLTGFDSKWINTLYMDKLMRYENIIQAFSRTNRLFGPEKPFGTIRYYRYPHTMAENIEKAVKLYSGDRPIDLFVEKLPENLRKMGVLYEEISRLFAASGNEGFEKLPESDAERGKFASLFKAFNEHLEAAKIQGFTWEQADKTESLPDENTYLSLVLRYKELFQPDGKDGGDDVGGGDIPYEIDGYLTEIDTGMIDAGYMNSRFDKYMRVLEQAEVDETEKQATLNELHKSFAMLTQEEQKYAGIFLHDVESGTARLTAGKTFREYITEYQAKAKNDQIGRISNVLGLDEGKLRGLMAVGVNGGSINEFGRFDDLMGTVDRAKARAYFEGLEGARVSPPKVMIAAHKLLREFVLKGGFEVEVSEGWDSESEGTSNCR